MPKALEVFLLAIGYILSVPIRILDDFLDILVEIPRAAWIALLLVGVAGFLLDSIITPAPRGTAIPPEISASGGVVPLLDLDGNRLR
jgi:hypothetical protein